MIEKDREFDIYFIGLLIQAIKEGDMEKRDKLVKEKEDERKYWEQLRLRITTKVHDNEY